MSDCIVEFDQVFFGREPGKWILQNLSFQIRKGETFALIGRSGCGKTTTLKLVNRLLEPVQGRVLVEGVSTSAWNAIRLRRRVGYIIQEIGLFPHFTVAQNVALVPRLEQWEPEVIDDRVGTLLNLVGLDPQEYSNRFPHELSGGQRQRVGVARALAVDPPILLMDEPFGALDPITRAELQSEFKQLQQHLHKTVILVTHDIHEALQLATHIGLMEHGVLMFEGSAEELLRSTTNKVRAYLRPLENRFRER